jgi:hypothetical protein
MRTITITITEASVRETHPIPLTPTGAQGPEEK